MAQNPDLEYLFNNNLKNHNKRYRVLCLSETPNNAQMWSHYADKHKGVMVKLDIEQDLDFFDLPLFVQYKSKYPSYNYIKRSHRTKKNEFVTLFLGTKSIDWKYEKEIRFIKDITEIYLKDEGLAKVKKTVLKEIVFGIKADEKDIDEAKEINKRVYDNQVKIKRATRIKNSFKLSIEDV